MIIKKLKATKNNKSPGVDGMNSAKTTNGNSTTNYYALARMFNVSLKEGVAPFKLKEANIIPLFIMVREIS